MKTATYRLTAHKFTEDRGFVATELFGTKGTWVGELASFAELDAKIAEFGTALAPCNVWVGCVSKPKPRGFDKWNNTPNRLFHATTAVA